MSRFFLFTKLYNNIFSINMDILTYLYAVNLARLNVLLSLLTLSLQSNKISKMQNTQIINYKIKNN